MAEKLSIEIALDGGKEIEKQLEGIGDAGQKAFDQIIDAAEKAGGFKKLDPQFVTDKLKELGVTGEDAINKINTAVKTAGQVEQFATGVKTLENAFAKLGTAGPEAVQNILRSLQETGRLEGVVKIVQGLQGAFAMFARVLGPIGLAVGAIGTQIAQTIQSTIKFAESINKVSAEAQNLGLSIEKFDQFRAGMEAAGISAQGISAALAKVKGDLDKLELERVTKNFNELTKEAAATETGAKALQKLQTEALKAGEAGQKARKELQKFVSPRGAEDAAKSLRELQEVATQAGEAGRQARKHLETLGLPIPDSAAKTLENIVRSAKGLEDLGKKERRGIGFAPEEIKSVESADQVARKLIETLATMPDNAERAQLALDHFGKAGPEINNALKTGALGVKQFTDQLPEYLRLTKEAELKSAGLTQATQRFSATWERTSSLAFAPSLTKTINTASDALVRWGRVLDDETKQSEASLQRNETAAGIAFRAIGQAAQDAVPRIKQGLAEARASLNQGWETSAFGQAMVGLAGIIQPAVAQIKQGLAEAKASLNQGWETSAFGQAMQSLAGIIQPAVAQIKQGISEAKASLNQGWETSAAGQAFTALVTLLEPAIERIKTGIAEAKGSLNQGWDTSAAAQAFQFLGGLLDRLIVKFRELIGVKAQLGSAGGGTVGAPSIGGGFAGGGRVGGRGTGTSDSNLAWLSRGEYITPARAVAQPGVLAFLEALRRSGGNLRRVLDGMGRFALGGMVPRTMPAFAAGGLTGMSNVTIQFPGLPAIGGLRASSDVVDELRKAAALAQVRSGGRKPSRYS